LEPSHNPFSFLEDPPTLEATPSIQRTSVGVASEVTVSINSNLNALRAVRRLDEASSARGRTFERLSSGSRINHASDDAAGLAVAMSLNADARVSSQAVRNISDGASFLNVADGAVKELKGILFRLRELSTQSSNGAFSNVQRSSLDKEAQALQAEYNRVIETAKFNGVSVFAGSVSIQAGMGRRRCSS
jgi:flagellin